MCDSVFVYLCDCGCCHESHVALLSASACLLCVQRAVELGGSSRTQAAAAAASFMTGFFPNSVMASLCALRDFLSHL